MFSPTAFSRSPCLHGACLLLFASAATALALQFASATTPANPPEKADGSVREAILTSIEDWIAHLQEGKYHPQENPAVRLSPFCPPGKLDEYREQHATFANDYLDTESYLADPEPQPVWQKGDFAASLLVFRDKLFPLNLKVIPVCLLRTNDQWQVAAGIHHFENTHFGFQKERWDASERLSRWAGSAAKDAQNHLEDRELAALRDEISQLRAERREQNPDSKEFVMAYIDAEFNGTPVNRLSFLHLPDDLNAREISEILATFEENPSRALTRLDAFREQDDPTGETQVICDFVATFEEDGQTSHVAGFFHPNNLSKCHVAPYYIIRVDDEWSIVSINPQVQNILPSSYQVKSDLREWFDENEYDQLSEFIDNVMRNSRNRRIADENLQSPQVASRTLLQALAERNFFVAMGLLHIPEESDYEFFDACLKWLETTGRRLRAESLPNVLRPLGEETDDRVALVFFQTFSPLRPEEQHIFSIYTMETDGHWHVVQDPGRVARAAWNFPDGVRKAIGRLMQVESERRPTLLQEARASLLADLPTPLPPEERPDPAELDIDAAQTTFEKFIAAAHKGSIRDMLEFSASLDGLRPGEIASSLESIGFALRDMHGKNRQTEILGIEKEQHWAAVALRTRNIDGPAPQEKMRLMVYTAEGWKVLAQGEFFREVNRGYRRLNQESAALLQTYLSESDVNAISTLRAWHASLPDAGDEATESAPPDENHNQPEE